MLSKRLQKIFDLASGEELWDIGCDHGLLAVYNSKVQKFRKVHCVDKSEAAVQQLRLDLLNRHVLSDEEQARISILQQDGTELPWDSVHHCVSIAGVGSGTILQILSSAPADVRARLHWVLGPHKSVEKLLSALPQLFPASHIQQFEVIEKSRQRVILSISPHLNQ